MHLSFKPHNPIHLLLFLILFHHLPLQAAPETIKQFDYTVEIPEGWKPMPNEELDKMLPKMKTDGKQYAAAYQQDVFKGSIRPKVALNYMEVAGIENSLFRDNININVPILKRKGINGAVVADSTAYRFYTVKDTLGRHLIFGECFGHDGVLSISYACDTADSREALSQFMCIYSSVKFNKPFKNKDEAKARVSDFLDKTFGVIFIVGLFFGIRYLVRRNRKKNGNNKLISHGKNL